MQFNEQQEKHLHELVMQESYAFDALMEGIDELGGHNYDDNTWQKPEFAKLSELFVRVHEIHGKIGTALGVFD